MNSKRVIYISAAGILLCLLGLYFYPLPQLKPYSKVIFAKDSTLLAAYLTPDDKWRMRTRLEDVSPDLIKAIIEKEDRWFYWHPGFNLFSILRASYKNLVEGRNVLGASTITMQLARILKPADRTYWSKFLEILRAIRLELHYSKDEILETYLSYLPMGGNIEGISSASYIYFNRPPSKLSPAQAITLAVIPNDPNSLRPDVYPGEAAKARNYWINKFREENIFSAGNLNDALDEPLEARRNSIPAIAPHFSNETAKKSSDDIIISSLGLRIQTIAEKLLSNHVNRVKGKGVTNGAILIIDNTDMSIAGYCGSVDFNDAAISGQVNGITATRSPGSALKPILYASALNEGLYIPAMKLLDIPTDFGGYMPENYDQKFNGDVTFDYALVNSLNVPAVRLLQQVGFNEFVNLLERGGFKDIAGRKNYLGLSLILGGCGVTLEQLTRFFSVFAKEGRLHNLNFISGVKDAISTKIFFEETCFVISEILKNNQRPDFPNVLSNTTKLPLIAWKTGTSYGKRDAWAIGYNPNFTIGVWMGNFDGKGSPHLSGAEIAVPLLFDLFNSIDYNPRKKWFDFPQDLAVRKVCKDSGLLPTEFCSDTTEDYYIRNVSQNKKCDVSKRIYVNDDETYEFCPDCLPSSGYEQSVFKLYPPELTLWYDENNISYRSPPIHNPKCKVIFSTGAPVIISPSTQFDYLIEENTNQQIKLQAASDASASFHFWYSDDKLLKKCKAGSRMFFSPHEGINKLVCVDDLGRSTEVEIKVKYY